ncbi:MAG TPA: ATP-dependent helicase C-terminal domain-containing protein [Vicinamibacterales bacterium]|nr:ATP-dependent helicase C-terminal domain-containing protein [Vicinamibacterales bacterium]
MLSPLPVDDYVPAILDHLRARRAVVVVAAPGAGKTTRVPPALTAEGPVMLLQPRRVAARNIARRVAGERGWTLGREVGWHIRFERRTGPETLLTVATEGILTARLQQDPLLSDIRTVVFDEFHERSIHSDLGLSLAKQAWRARDDLRIVVMSATLNAGRVSAYLDGCPVIDVPGTLHPLEITYRPQQPIAGAAADLLRATPGHVLCFVAGAGEARKAAGEIRSAVDGSTEVVELHGSLSSDEQDRALVPSARRRVIVATNIAETSLTVPGVTGVVDTGQHKVARYDAARGIDTLQLERIPADAAEQRAGRAGRLATGTVRRLWHEADRLRPHREPDIARIDLSAPVLDILAWGGDLETFEWFEHPAGESLAAAMELLRLVGAAEGGRLTATGRRMCRLPLHPRLARILIEAGGAWEAAVACALLSDRSLQPRHPATTTCDLLVDRRDLPPHVLQNAEALQRAAGGSGRCDDVMLRRALFAGYADRVARRRGPGDPRVLMATGHGARIGDESGVRTGEFVVALDVQGGRRGQQSEARIRVASIVERDWIAPTAVRLDHEVDESGVVRAVERELAGAIVLRERSVPPDPAIAASRLAAAFLARPLPDADGQLLNRLRFAGREADVRQLAEAAAAGRRRVDDVRLADALDWTTRETLETLAPATFTAPSGRTHRLEYREDGTVALAIKLQELFGLADTPRIGPQREPLLILLLAPNGRPVQTTRDLRSFWTTTYPDVRRELRGRYPRHPWPEDPWQATPTARTRRPPTS